MYKFILVSSSNDNIKEYRRLITKVFMHNNVHYECYEFNDNDKKLYNFLENKCYKEHIYIIEDNSTISSIDVLTKIRLQFKDLRSFVIIIDFNKAINLSEFESDFFTKIVDKRDMYLIQLENHIKSIVKLKTSNDKQICFYHNRISYTIGHDEIDYVEKEINSKLTKIVSNQHVFHIKKTIQEVKKMLGSNFVQTHRSALVNINNIEKVNFKTNVITFKDGIKMDLISRNQKKILKEKLTKQEQKATN